MMSKSSRFTSCLLLLLVTPLFVAVDASPARAATFAVNSTADVADQSPGDGKCETGNTAPNDANARECTLRAAIQEAEEGSGCSERLGSAHFTLKDSGDQGVGSAGVSSTSGRTTRRPTRR